MKHDVNQSKENKEVTFVEARVIKNPKNVKFIDDY